MKKFRMGIIGCGGISASHIRGIMESPDLEIGALCDILPEKLEEKKALCGADADMCYDDYIKMMESGKIDALSICTPNNKHYQMAMDAVERGIPFAVEKPVCMTEAEAAVLLDATEKKKLAHMVCFSYRFVAAARYARDLVLNGDLGKIYHINGEYYQAWGLPDARSGSAAPLVWRFVKEVAASGALGDLGCHMLDLCRFITGREFTSVMADMDTFIHERKLPGSDEVGTVDVDDYINIVGQMDGQLAANVAISRYAYSRGNYQRVEVYGDRGALRYNLESRGTLEINIGNEPMRNGRIWVEVPIPPKYNITQMQSFADILNGRGDGLAASLVDGRAVQRVLDSSVLSAEKGIRIKI
ncbi:MAG: Gfo/Idh/MocA family oxidoreductase [Oscillospiraceae bacterium]|nr:Gfo/Idh/MocA family oxidoreductase [Oscillospiraceae bacterium]